MLNEELSHQLLSIARRSVEGAVKGEKAPAFDVSAPELLRPCGAFVTLEKHGDLRGCIGYPEPVRPLWQAVSEAAQSAALRDPRFPPVRAKELKDLAIEVSVLSDFRPFAGPEALVVGRDGLYIRKGFYSGLLLPQVASEYGWDAEEFLRHVCRKAGLPEEAWRSEEADLKVFEVQLLHESE